MSDATPSEIEDAILESWKSLLDRQDVSREDDFFLLGGDSLVGALLVTKLSALSGDEVSLLDLYDHSTFGAQVDLVVQLREMRAATVVQSRDADAPEFERSPSNP